MDVLSNFMVSLVQILDLRSYRKGSMVYIPIKDLVFLYVVNVILACWFYPDVGVLFIVQDKTFEHPYLQAIGSHT